MKECSDCHEIKCLTKFRPKPSGKDGYEIRCMDCRNQKYNKDNPLRVARKIYNSQISHSVTRGHPSPNYTFDQLLDWLDKQPSLLGIWRAYEKSGYQSDLRPSVDRLNDSKAYTLDNIQLMTWGENRSKGANDKKNGINNSCNRAVKAYTPDGMLHKEYHSIMDAVRDLDARMWGIVSVANGKPVKDGKGKLYMPKTYKGFVWKWS